MKILLLVLTLVVMLSSCSEPKLQLRSIEHSEVQNKVTDSLIVDTIKVLKN